MKSWNNGEYGKVVKEIIDGNFDDLDKRTINLEKSNSVFIKIFSPSDWKSGTISIAYSEYQKQNPCVEVYIKTGGSYTIVYGGYVVTSDGIELQSDLQYEGKVVIR